MILGAADGQGWEKEAVEVKKRRPTGRKRKGRYKPWEFGRITLWQMTHLFGYGTREREAPYSPKKAFWVRCRSLGMTETETYLKWVDEFKPALDGASHESEDDHASAAG